MQWRDEKYGYKSLVGMPEEKRSLGNSRLCGMILKCILKKQCLKTWTSFTWLFSAQS